MEWLYGFVDRLPLLMVHWWCIDGALMVHWWSFDGALMVYWGFIHFSYLWRVILFNPAIHTSLFEHSRAGSSCCVQRRWILLIICMVPRISCSYAAVPFYAEYTVFKIFILGTIHTKNIWAKLWLYTFRA